MSQQIHPCKYIKCSFSMIYTHTHTRTRTTLMGNSVHLSQINSRWNMVARETDTKSIPTDSLHLAAFSCSNQVLCTHIRALAQKTINTVKRNVSCKLKKINKKCHDLQIHSCNSSSFHSNCQDRHNTFQFFYLKCQYGYE